MSEQPDHVETKGLSPKLTAPLAATLSAFAYSSITTGAVNRSEFALLAVAGINALAAWWAPIGKVVASSATQNIKRRARNRAAGETES